MNAKLEQFRATLETAQHAGLIARGYNPDHHSHDCRVKIGRKYANVDVGGSGKYMVELSTGKIYGIKGYGVIHRGHQFGTLDTIADWNWSGYRAQPAASIERGISDGAGTDNRFR